MQAHAQNITTSSTSTWTPAWTQKTKNTIHMHTCKQWLGLWIRLNKDNGSDYVKSAREVWKAVNKEFDTNTHP